MELKKGEKILYLPNEGVYETMNNKYVTAIVLIDAVLPKTLPGYVIPSAYCDIRYTRDYITEDGMIYSKINTERIYTAKKVKQGGL